MSVHMCADMRTGVRQACATAPWESSRRDGSNEYRLRLYPLYWTSRETHEDPEKSIFCGRPGSPGPGAYCAAFGSTGPTRTCKKTAKFFTRSSWTLAGHPVPRAVDKIGTRWEPSRRELPDGAVARAWPMPVRIPTHMPAARLQYTHVYTHAHSGPFVLRRLWFHGLNTSLQKKLTCFRACELASGVQRREYRQRRHSSATVSARAFRRCHISYKQLLCCHN